MRRTIIAFGLALVAFSALVLGMRHEQQAIREARAGNGDQNNPSQAVDSGYAPDRGNFQVFRSTITGADARTTTAVLALPAFQVQGRVTMLLGARFSVSGANAVIQLAYVWRKPTATSDTSVATTTTFSWKTATWASPWQNQAWTVADNVVKGWSQAITLTAGTLLTEGAYYPAADYYLDTERADTIRVVVNSVSSGNVSFWAGS